MLNLTRREFVRVSALISAGSVITACTVTTTEPPSTAAAPSATTASPAAPAVPTAVPARYGEAPSLAELAKQGTIPPVEDRLPLEPLILDPVEQIGQYGGTCVYMATGTGLDSMRVLAYNEPFLKGGRDQTGWMTPSRPNLITAFEWNEEGTELTLFFRKGIKWSDGEPLTVDDYLFWWNDLVLDENVNVLPPRGTVVKDVPMTMDRIDDYTVKLSFAGPNPVFLDNLSNGGGGNRSISWHVVPAHYFKRYHYKYNKELPATSTEDLALRYDSREQYADCPHFGPWVTSEARVGELCHAERNPYYWKTDTDGNQLPYLDSVELRLVQNTELITMSAINGELDFQMRSLDIGDTPLLMDNQEKGGYEVRMWDWGGSNKIGIHFHFCYPDPAISELLWNQKFRQALSWAINRERINDMVFLGLGVAQQYCMQEKGVEFLTPRGKEILEKWHTQCAAYEPDTAKGLLDEIGVVDANGDGNRELPGGAQLQLVMDVNVASKPEVSSGQLIVEDWKAIGLDVILNAIDGTMVGQRMKECASMLRIREVGGSGLHNGPYHWAPVEEHDACMPASGYGLWYQSGGKQGIPPPEGSALQKLQEIYADAMGIVDPDKRNDRILDGYQVHLDEGPLQLGCVGQIQWPIVVKRDLHNVTPNGNIMSWLVGFPGTGDPEQWYKA